MATASRPCSIVLVEDNEDTRQTVDWYLQLQGHSVRTAKDGEEGLALITEVRPDLALIDIGLPKMDGYEVAKRVRASGMKTHLVAYTAYGAPEDRQRAFQSGFDTHLSKAVEPDEMKRMVRAVCEQAKSTR